MAGLWKQFAMDEDAEQRGMWFVFDGFRVRLARAGGTNKRYMRTLERESKPVQVLIDNKLLKNDQANEMMKRVIAEAVVLGWETKNAAGEWEPGIESQSGELLPCTVANVLKTFDALPEVYEAINKQANDLSNYRVAELETEAGN